MKFSYTLVCLIFSVFVFSSCCTAKYTAPYSLLYSLESEFTEEENFEFTFINQCGKRVLSVSFYVFFRENENDDFMKYEEEVCFSCNISAWNEEKFKICFENFKEFDSIIELDYFYVSKILYEDESLFLDEIGRFACIK